MRVKIETAAFAITYKNIRMVDVGSCEDANSFIRVFEYRDGDYKLVGSHRSMDVFLLEVRDVRNKFYPTIKFRNGRDKHCGSHDFSMYSINGDNYSCGDDYWTGTPRSVHIVQ